MTDQIKTEHEKSTTLEELIEKGKQGKLSDSELEEEIRAVVEAVNEKIPNYKRIRKIEILKSGLEKTTTRKVKRFGSNVE